MPRSRSGDIGAASSDLPPDAAVTSTPVRRLDERGFGLRFQRRDEEARGLDERVRDGGGDERIARQRPTANQCACAAHSASYDAAHRDHTACASIYTCINRPPRIRDIFTSDRDDLVHRNVFYALCLPRCQRTGAGGVEVGMFVVEGDAALPSFSPVLFQCGGDSGQHAPALLALLFKGAGWRAWPRRRLRRSLPRGCRRRDKPAIAPLAHPAAGTPRDAAEAASRLAASGGFRRTLDACRQMGSRTAHTTAMAKLTRNFAFTL